MAGCPTRDQLASFLSGSVGAAEEEALCGHVEGCARCQAALETLVGAATPAALRAPDPVPNAAFLERLKSDPLTAGWSAPGWGTSTRPGTDPGADGDFTVE